MDIRIALIAGCTGCLIAETPDGEWRALTNDCIPLGEDPTPVLRNESYLHAFRLAGDTVLFDDDGGVAQVSLGDYERSLIARTNSDDASTEFQTIENSLLYYARGELGLTRELVVDHGIYQTPRWETIAEFSTDDFTRVHANRAGVFWRSDNEARWRRWDRANNTVGPAGIPGMAQSVTTDGNLMFYSFRPATSFDTHELYTLPVEGGTPTHVGTVRDFVEPVGISDGRLFVWDNARPNTLSEVTDTGLRAVTNIPEIGVAGRHTFGGGYFYWVPIVPGPDSIRRVNLDTGSQQRVATIPVGEGEFGTIQADGCNVYWQVVREGFVDLYAQRH